MIRCIVAKCKEYNELTDDEKKLLREQASLNGQIVA
jgi:hypothetical protein